MTFVPGNRKRLKGMRKKMDKFICSVWINYTCFYSFLPFAAQASSSSSSLIYYDYGLSAYTYIFQLNKNLCQEKCGKKLIKHKMRKDLFFVLYVYRVFTSPFTAHLKYACLLISNEFLSEFKQVHYWLRIKSRLLQIFLKFHLLRNILHGY